MRMRFSRLGKTSTARIRQDNGARIAVGGRIMKITKKNTLSVLLLCLVLVLTAVRAGAESGFTVGGQHPGMALDPGENGVRATVPFTVKGKQYLLRLIGEDGALLWIGQQEGGGQLVFDVSFVPLPEHAASFELILSSDAERFAPVVIPLSYVPESTVSDPADDGCSRDASCILRRFSDLDPAAWYHDGIHAVLEGGIMNGYEDGTFRPDSSASRAMIVTMLWRMERQPQVRYDLRFADVPDGAWYTEAVRWAVSAGIVSGYDASSFGPNDGVTREQLAAILYRYAASRGEVSLSGEGDPLDRFGDAGQISPWALDAMRWAVGRGLINGTGGGKLSPRDHASRAQVAAVLARFSS